jgi:single-strand DNA-binding protein
MADLNKVFLVGNLTRDPEVRYTSSGSAVGDMRLAVSDRYRNKAGEVVEQTCFVDVVVWGRQAETSGEYLSKGSPILVEGRLQLDEWQTQQGEKRSKLRVVANRVQFLGSPRRAEYGDAPDDARPARRESPPGDAPPPDDAPQGDDAPAPAGDDDDLPF